MQNLGTRLLRMCSVGKRLKAWFDALRVTVDGNRTVAVELIDDHGATKTAMDETKTAVDDLIDRQAENMTAIVELIVDHGATKTAVDETKTAVDDLIDRQAENMTAIVELIDDHDTFKNLVDELKSWAEALATKLNADGGVTDEDYDATISASSPDTLSVGDPTAITASKPTAGPATLSAGDPDAVPAALEVFE